MHRPVHLALLAAVICSLSVTTALSAGPRLSASEARFVRSIERRLRTRRDLKNDPKDEQTWYTILVVDRVVSRTVGVSSDSATIATLRAAKPDGVVVQGKRNAALTIARYLVGGNAAAKGLRPLRTSETVNATGAAGDKQWNFRAFATRAEAEAFLAALVPRSVKKRR